jgi:hypothetical protein
MSEALAGEIVKARLAKCAPAHRPDLLRCDLRLVLREEAMLIRLAIVFTAAAVVLAPAVFA